ncbi:Uncharacterised protein [Pragia fontium]|uniref:hypothetical protein n=1 Tax=Pragia fontium TaxID=82985 RepID=UPI000DF917A6|nr:hypothetical protein [Pragia fontium]SUB81861.1 Uncharacterised protein [Pragia fontium]
MAKSGNTLGKIVAMPTMSSSIADANPAIVAETLMEKEKLNILVDIVSAIVMDKAQEKITKEVFIKS